MLKTIIDVIEVDDDANIEVRLKLLNEIGTNQPVITKFEDILTVTESNFGTQGHNGKVSQNKSDACTRSKRNIK